MKSNPVQITRKKEKSKIVPVQTGDEVILSADEVELLDAFAGILEYPADDWSERLIKCHKLCLLSEKHGTADFSGFASDATELTLNQSQELYTRTFDLNPVCALEVGYHLFGEDYKRGQFLAQMRETENPYELGQERQLPDYLPVVLRLLGKMDDPELRAGLIGYCLLPALKKMKEHLEKKNNPYESVFTCLEKLLNRIAEESIGPKAEVATARLQHA
ncbi:MAG: nitrate reductase molybdenum cofactor assembly chaperone [Acidobacteriota bacterium]|nr:nitrate reductase molybdenum cofactor assembly chaperone [Acidobacteriota bacterium]MDH3530757.1 nitrate reductase molybdenum cofactor assembly chaperone [Acidobacteriota bacterium]